MRLSTLLCCLLGTLSLAAQRGDNVLAAREAYDLGAAALVNQQYKKAARQFRNATRFDEDFTEAYRMWGITEDLQQNYPEALRLYEVVMQADSLFSRLMYYQIGQLHYKLNRPNEALDYLRQFQALQEEKLITFGIRGEQERENELEALAELDHVMAAVKITRDSAEFINLTEIRNVGKPINSPDDDYFPYYSNDGRKLLFTRQRTGLKSKDEDLIRARRKNLSDLWVTSKVGSFNTNKPEGMITLIRDGERVFFTLCGENEHSVGGCDIFSGLLIDGKVQNIQPLDEYVNSTTWDSQAGISCDGRKLIFASTRPGGVGGSDLWFSEVLYDGHWSRPKNLGLPVNSPKNEQAPFLSNDGKTLYFTSDGHNTLGASDIFMSWWNEQENRWGRPINLGPPVNSPHEELGFHLSSDNKTGFFASDRPGGEGGLDIYQFALSNRLSSDPVTYISGYVLDSITGEPIVDVEVPMNGGPRLRTNYEGRFFVCAGADEVLEFSTEPTGYLAYRNSFAVPEWENTYPYRIDLLVQPLEKPAPAEPVVAEVARPDTVRKRIALVKRNHSVLFNFGESVIIPRQQSGLDLFLENVLGEQIQEVSITGYADDIGESDFNLKLSEDRAKAVGVYLRNAGITTDSVTIKGAGMIIGGRRELNRRVEIQVVIIREH